jgi:aldose 1-epimerase
VSAAASLLLLAASVVEVPYGTTRDGQRVTQVELRNGRGMAVRFIGYGATITDIVVPDGKGRPANVALGFASLADYEAKNGNYAFGAVMGRYVGRIARAQFRIDGKLVSLTPNDGPNALHGGPGSFDTKVWSVTPFRRGRDVGATLAYTSPAGEQGFPGRLDVKVTYTLTPRNALRIDYEARTDSPTVLNLTNHSYFNLAGAGSGTVRDHRLRIDSRRILETDSGGIPTGRYLDVEGTPFDFRHEAEVGEMMDRPHRQMEGRRGFNHSWVLGHRGRLAFAARLKDPKSGRRLDVFTTEPSLHVYTANWFSGQDRGAQGILYRRHDGIALETQHYPNSPNEPAFPSTLLRPGETFRSTTVYRFSSGKPK